MSPDKLNPTVLSVFAPVLIITGVAGFLVPRQYNLTSGAAPTFILDYSGPPFIRSIVDEVREVAPGLYVGPAALLVKGRPKPILFFAVSLQA